MKRYTLAFVLSLIPCLQLSQAADLTIHLAGDASFSRQSVRVECDANGVKMGLPAGVFSVVYINGGGNSLAIVPVSGESLIFANVIAGSGARYAAKQYIWWDAAGRVVTFSSDSLAGKMQSVCHHVKTRSDTH